MRTLVSSVVMLLAGCAAFSDLVPGASGESDVIAKFGQPAAARTLPDGGKVFEYPREPEGMQNWRVTLAQDGTVRSVEQLVDEPVFAKILPGLSRDQVLLALGLPSEERSYQNLQENVVSWRYRAAGSVIMFFNAHFDPTGYLKYTSRSLDPLANSNSMRRR